MRHPLLCCIAFLSILYATSCTKDTSLPQAENTDTLYYPGNKVPFVDAGAFRQVTFPDTVHLKGSGIDSDGTVQAYLWSQVSGPDESSLLNPGDAETTVSFPTFGTYQFQLMIIDNDGATGLDTVSVLVLNTALDSVNLSSSIGNYMDLTFAGNSAQNYTDPNGPEIALADWTFNSGDDILRAAVQFDMSAIPATATIISAKLTLFSNPTPMNGNLVDANYGSQNAFHIRRITDDWTMTAGWFNQPGTTTDGEVAIAQAAQGRLDLVDVDVSALVQGMITNGNHGFFLKLDQEVQFNSRIFCGVRYSDASKHPVLKIVYRQ